MHLLFFAHRIWGCCGKLKCQNPSVKLQGSDLSPMANVKAEGQIGLQRPDRSKKVRLECKGQNEVYDHEALQTSRPLEAT